MQARSIIIDRNSIQTKIRRKSKFGNKTQTDMQNNQKSKNSQQYAHDCSIQSDFQLKEEHKYTTIFKFTIPWEPALRSTCIIGYA
jgi:hypothetical protein